MGRAIKYGSIVVSATVAIECTVALKHNTSDLSVKADHGEHKISQSSIVTSHTPNVIKGLNL